jgi:hypothetical protein
MDRRIFPVLLCSNRIVVLSRFLRKVGEDVGRIVEYFVVSLPDFNNPNELDDEDDSDDDDDDKEDADADDDDEDDDDEDEDYGDSETSSTSPPSSTENPFLSATPDPYLTNFDPENEREEFLAAKERMEKHHEDRVSKVLFILSREKNGTFFFFFLFAVTTTSPFQVMKDWGVMEEKYQDIKIADPEKAEKYRKEMTSK